MEPVIVFFLIFCAFASLILSAFLTLITKRTWARFGLLAAILFFGGCILGYTTYRYSAKEAWRNKSPDGRFYVVIYRLPNFSMTPGSGSDGAAIGQLFDASGRLLHQGDIEMLMMADVDWTDEEVMVGNHIWSLK